MVFGHGQFSKEGPYSSWWALACFVTLITLLAVPGTSAAQEAGEPEIKVTDTPHDDAIQGRLKAVLAAMDEASDIGVTVESGVVTLTGEVANASAARELTNLARRVQGVIHVQNRLTDETAISSRLQPLGQRLENLGTEILRNLPVIVLALVIIIVFWIAGRWAGNHSRWLRRIGLPELTSQLGRRILRLVVTGLGFLIALEILDATALFGALLGVAGVAGIALGFAFRNIVENYLAGVLLSIRHPFGIGDFIEVGSSQGSVVRLTSRDTVLMTPGGNHLRIPNSIIITSVLTNFSRNPLSRFDFTLGVSADADPVRAKELGVATIAGMRGILADPRPRVLMTELGEGIMKFRFLAWIDQRDTDPDKARSEALRLVKTAYDQAEMKMPGPRNRVILRRPEEDDVANAPQRKPIAAPEEIDVATDNTLSRQVEADLRESSEENLLSGKGRTNQR
ncbi:mechanosensitive ion channel family protein [Marinobacter salicampi]|uniref:mechanosensitive ion channel family protein n=1 Tax=Marinobacter salicampi TaxID=435907 RepID=UPI00140A87A6|nr:mechanosensitive ion channel family protein [Marinobacter salicampi]